MPHPTPAVNSILQASILATLAFAVKHWTLEHGFTPLTDFSEAYRHNVTTSASLNVTETSDAGPDWNITVSGTPPEEESSELRDFLLSDLPKNMVAIVLISALRYWWLIWLERVLPARPRPRRTSTAASTVNIDDKDDDSREEEVIRKWIEAGKVRRASLSWCNTTGKWILDLTLWNLFHSLLWQVVIKPAMRRTAPWIIFSTWQLMVSFTAKFFGIAPIVTVIGFVLIPAHKRVVFENGVDLAWKTFFGVLVSVAVPSLMAREGFREFVGNMTDSMIEGERVANQSMMAPDLEGADEL